MIVEPMACIRPDGEIFLANERFIIDVGITNPAAITHARVGQTQLGAARKYENDKIQHYLALTSTKTVKMIPFILEAFGAFGSHADKLISLITAHAHAFFGTAQFGFRRRFIDLISISLQRHNAVMALKGLQLLANQKGRMVVPGVNSQH